MWRRLLCFVHLQTNSNPCPARIPHPSACLWQMLLGSSWGDVMIALTLDKETSQDMLERIQDFRQGVQDTDLRRGLPCRGSRGFIRRKIFKIQVLGNGFSDILMSSQRVRISCFPKTSRWLFLTFSVSQFIIHLWKVFLVNSQLHILQSKYYIAKLNA